MATSKALGAKYVPFLVFMIIGYVVFVQGIFGWLLFLEKGDSFLIAGTFRDLSVNTVSRLAPYVVAGVCVYGWLKRQTWAWWLTLLAVGYELATYLPNIGRYLSFSSFGVAGMFKLAWLLGISALLLPTRQRDA